MKKEYVQLYKFMTVAPEDDAPRNHSIYEEELLRKYIISRDPKALEYAKQMFDPRRAGKMSNNEFLQILFLAVSTITLITRNCIEAGMPEVEAFAISDMFLQKLNLNMPPEDIYVWHTQCMQMFFALLPDISSTSEDPEPISGKTKIFSPIVTQTINYVLKNLRSPILLKEVSTKLSISADYLSNLFHTETGITFSKFVRKHKIEAAKELLIHTDYSSSEVANALGFNSQSYFIKVFKEETGLTPKQFITPPHTRYFKIIKNPAWYFSGRIFIILLSYMCQDY